MSPLRKAVIVSVLLSLAVFGCASPTPQASPPVVEQPTQAAQPTQAPAATEAVAAKPIRVALILPGVITDAGWNASAYEGLQAAKDQLGVEVAYSESVAPPDYEATFRDYASQGYDIVIGHGSEFGDAALTVAKEFPNTYFAVTNAAVKAPNVAGLDTLNEQSTYMGGFVAGTVTKTKIVGFVGAAEILAMKRGEDGFKLGVAAACPDCQVLVSYTGSFDDVAKGKEAGLAMIDAGADVLLQDADASGLGVIEAAKEKGVMAIGLGGDQSSLAPDNVVTTCLQVLAPVIVSIVREVQDGTFVPDQVRLYGYHDGTYDLAPLNEKLVTPDQAKAILAERDRMFNGEIKLPHLAE